MNGKRLGYILIGLVLLIEIPRFYGTYADLDPLLFDLPLTAIGTGIVLPVGAGYVFNTWWSTRKMRRDWLLVAFAVLLVLEGFILVPWGMSQLQSEPLADTVGSGLFAWVWITVVMESPFVLIGAAAMAVAFQTESRTTTTKTDQKSERPERKPEQTGPFECSVCGRSYRTQAALNGHMNAHRPKELVT